MAHTDLLSIHAREKAGMPEDWEAYAFDLKPPYDDPRSFYEVKGAVAPRIGRGPNRGERNWRRMDCSTDRTVYIQRCEQEAWERDWERRTGNCRHCLGKGTRVVGGSVEGGPILEPCDPCGGRGKAAGAVAEGVGHGS